MTTYTRIAALLLFLTLGAPQTGRGQAKSPEQLGKVDFPNSCTPAVQATFQRSVAMLHSFRYAEAEKTFREVLAQDPTSRPPRLQMLTLDELAAALARLAVGETIGR